MLTYFHIIIIIIIIIGLSTQNKILIIFDPTSKSIFLYILYIIIGLCWCYIDHGQLCPSGF